MLSRHGVMLGRVLDLRVNGRAEMVADGTTVADVVRRWCASSDGVAVACNGDIVPRSAWPQTALCSGDRIEIVTAAAGG